MAAMDAVGFAETERRSSAVRLSDLAGFANLPDFSVLPGQTGQPVAKSSTSTPVLTLPDLTVYDLTDWIDRFVSTEAPPRWRTPGSTG